MINDITLRRIVTVNLSALEIVLLTYFLNYKNTTWSINAWLHTGQPALAGTHTPNEELEDFAAAKFYFPRALADGN